jgi:uncharacterized protein
VTSTTIGHFIWHEHLTKDPKAAIAFYTEVTGWSTQAFAPGGDYVMWVGSQGPLGGVYGLPDEAVTAGVPSHWMGHVRVEDVDATVALTTRLGGKVHKPPTDIPTVGRYAIIADPQGAFISVFAPSHAMTPHDVSRPGEVCWNELLTHDSAAAFEFYAALFGWKQLQAMDMAAMGTYRIFGVGDQRLGGMMRTPMGQPMWMYYVDTTDLDAAIASATKRGAKVMNGPMEVPGGARIAQLIDPQGAAFALHESAKP